MSVAQLPRILATCTAYPHRVEIHPRIEAREEGEGEYVELQEREAGLELKEGGGPGDVQAVRHVLRRIRRNVGAFWLKNTTVNQD